MKVRVKCPAKLNLSLVVLEPEPSGYHPIRTVFQAIDLFDEIVVESSAMPMMEIQGMDLPPENTLTKVLRHVGEAFVLPGLAIKLVKRIPTESGLGGGSSDAAGLLKALDRFLPTPIPEHHKHEIAVSVGADVPFFLIGGRALGEGYGEKLTPLDDPADTWYVLARPDVGVSTSAAYAALDCIQFSRPSGAPIGHNDFERVAPCESLDLIERLASLGGSPAMLSGSGSAVFGQFNSEWAAQLAADDLRARATPWVAVAKNLPRSAMLIEEL